MAAIQGQIPSIGRNGHVGPPALTLVGGEPRFDIAVLPTSSERPETNPYDALRDQLRGQLERSIYEIGGMRVKWLKVHSFMLAELDTAIGECVKAGVSQKAREERFTVLLDMAQGFDIGNTRANTLYVTACRQKVLSGCAKLDATSAAIAHTPEQHQLEEAVRGWLGSGQYLHALRTVLIQKEYHRKLKVPLVVEKHLMRAEELAKETRHEAEQGRFSKSRAGASKICTVINRAVHAAKSGLYRAAGLRPHDAALTEEIFYTLLEDTLTAVDTIRAAKKRAKS